MCESCEEQWDLLEESGLAYELFPGGYQEFEKELHYDEGDV